MKWLSLLDHGPDLVGFILLAISLSYFLLGKGTPLKKRILKSSHGILFVCALVYAAIASKYTHFGYEGWLNYPFYIFLILGISAVIYSLWGMLKVWYYHLVHVFTLSYGVLVGLYGGLALAHDSL